MRIFLTAAFSALAFIALQSPAPTMADSKEKAGAPTELIGHWGSNKEQCQSWHRKIENVTSIDKNFLTSCGGSMCDAAIVSHKKPVDGFILKFKSRGNPEGWSQRYNFLDANTVEIFDSEKKLVETLVRCGMQDKIAGIGFSNLWTEGFSNENTKAHDLMFAAYYALEIPSVCPKLQANKELIVSLVRKGLSVYGEFLTKLRSSSTKPLEEVLRDEAESVHGDAKYTLEQDAQEISEFCVLAFDVFGNDGKVYPNLILDESRKL